MDDAALRGQLAQILDWGDAHVTFEKAVKGIPHELRGRRPKGLPHSVWELVEHIRIAQRDIFEFCVNPAYKEMRWPEDYWPPASEQPTAAQWEQSLRDYAADCQKLKQLAADADLFARIPHGSGQTYLREIQLVADHTAYHVGQIVFVRHALGVWPGA